MSCAWNYQSRGQLFVCKFGWTMKLRDCYGLVAEHKSIFYQMFSVYVALTAHTSSINIELPAAAAARFLIFIQTQTNRFLCNKNVNKQISLLIWIIKWEIMFFLSQLLLVLSAYILLLTLDFNSSYLPRMHVYAELRYFLFIYFFFRLPSRCLLHPIDVHIYCM